MDTVNNIPISTLLDLLRYRASDDAGTADKTAFTFLEDGEKLGGTLTFSELDRKARSIAAHLQKTSQAGDRVLLVLPAGLEYICAFFGCVYAGVIAVPALPPTNARGLPRLALIAKDAQPRIALAMASMLTRIEELHIDANAIMDGLTWLTIDSMPDESLNWKRPELQPSTIAFLQYTSGSTGTPKGVMVAHQNILANVALSTATFNMSEKDVVVSWLPPHHDFGLIGGILSCIYAGCHSVQFPASAFLLRPYRWLKAISDYRARITGAPNFAYELCVNKITDEKKSNLDLSCLELALNGAEPIRPGTLKRFAQAFSPCGFQADAFTPVYGLAEATLLVSANMHKNKHAWPHTLSIDKKALENGTVNISANQADAIEIVSTGIASSGEHQAIIVDPVSLAQCAENAIGEIWVHGPSVASGYWRAITENQANFSATPIGRNETFLRTGDLGFIHQSELYITGRMKEMMIFNGRNIYPQDIEVTVESIDPAFRANGCAAFSIEHDEQSRLVIVQEIEHRHQINFEAMLVALKAALGEQHAIFNLFAVLLIKAGSLPRTSSGKIQRMHCKELFKEGKLVSLWKWQDIAAGIDATPTGVAPAPVAPDTSTEHKLALLWAEILDMKTVSVTDNFFDLGGTSSLIVLLHERLNKEFGKALTLADLFKYPTIRSLAGFLSDAEPAHDRLPDHFSHVRKNQSADMIAIIGMSGRFPGAKNITEFWNKLTNGVECIRPFSDEEMKKAGMDDAMRNNPHFVNAGALLDDIDMFDADFFNFLPREAEITDPQHRLFLECSWHALENAGYDPSSFDGQIGVFAGASISTYLLNNLSSNQELTKSVGDVACLIGNDKDYLATRTSYKLNLRGPSVTVQTACSTSLVAVHMACQSLQAGESDLALAGGISIRDWDKCGYAHSEGNIFSADGHIRAFDAQASGTLFGSGVGVVVLKRLEQAISDGDTIHAIIKGTGITNDGADKVGYTAPSISGQTMAIAKAQIAADTPADTVTYIEAHGTATPLGDPIEVHALTQAFRLSTDKKQYCAIGSVKTNVGHLECAAGITGLIKTALALKHQVIPPSLNFDKPNPQIDFDNSPFFVNTELRPWQSNGMPRRAGINSFGFGGTNVHMIMEEAPPALPSGDTRKYHLLTLSARTRTALEATTVELANFLRKNPDLNLADVAYTGHVGRRRFNHRRTLVCDSVDNAIRLLEVCDPGSMPTLATETAEYPIVFMFPGQGSQYVNMAKDLYRDEAIFRSEVDTCAELLQPMLGLDLRAILFPPEERIDDAATQLNNTRYTQPALFVIEYALAKLLQSWGIKPDVMVGHSIGEYVTACLAGVFTLPDALMLVAHRGRLIAGLPPGSMLAVLASEHKLQSLLDEGLWIAAINAPEICSVSGDRNAIEKLKQRLQEQQIDFQTLNTSHAFHSGMMDPILDDFAQCLSKVRLERPRIPYLSNVSGDWIQAQQATDPRYWVDHLRNTVRFADCLEKTMQMPRSLLLEIGPGNSLSGLAKQQGKQTNEFITLSTLPRPKSASSSCETLLDTLGKLWLYGTAVDWKGFYRDQRRHRIALPGYPFERKRFWIEPSARQHQHASKAAAGKHADIAEWFYAPSWKRSSVSIAPESVHASESATHLVFSDRYGLDQIFIDDLRHNGDNLIIVKQSNVFLAASPDSFTIDHTQPEHYERLFAALQQQGRFPTRISHLWGVSPSNTDAPVDQHDHFFSLLFLAQAFGKLGITTEVMINVITNGIHSVSGSEQLFPDRATALGPCHVIPLEYPHIKCRNIDITINGALPIDKTSSRLLLAEIYSQAAETVVAYRGRYRWVQTFEQIPLQSSAIPIKLRRNGHYLITGGLGGIGLTFAQYLADKALSVKITLVGRSSLPDPAMWASYLQMHDEQDALCRKIRQIQAMELQGNTVRYIAADMTDNADVTRLSDTANSEFGAVHGIFHAAGLPGDEPIQSKTVKQAHKVLAPKLIGAPLLEKMFTQEPLDFLMLCSSMGAIAPVVGQVDYCAANAFLDAFAHERQLSKASHIVSINWNSWQEVGMAANMALPQHLQKQHEKVSYLSNGITVKDAPAIFDFLLSNHLPQVLVSPIDLDAVRAYTHQINTLLNPALNPDLPAAAADRSQGERPKLSVEYVAPRNILEQSITDIWQDLFGISPIGIHDDFFDLGGHSLLTTQMMSKMRSTFQIDLSVKALFEATTIAKLAHVIETSSQESEEIEV
ncbi:MAG TPA: SDR family NAD(P)-dependent oxidoreductase [Burkholderiaceae bacterium]|jgi:acyl transferase domain-containing protein/acyl-CoA synthetase (AMP-forming)/AMP-acid ligase II/acyl carrier protein